jgi:hypothetical protein
MEETESSDSTLENTFKLVKAKIRNKEAVETQKNSRILKREEAGISGRQGRILFKHDGVKVKRARTTNPVDRICNQAGGRAQPCPPAVMLEGSIQLFIIVSRFIHLFN